MLGESGGTARRGAWAALLALIVGAPALRIPFLSDDWTNLAAVADGISARTPYGYFRPLYLATLRGDLLLWGLRPAGFHVTNLLLIAGCAALVVALVHRYSGSREVAGLAGVLFALHPYHVECAAWISARADSLAALLLLGAALCYDRWRFACRGLPLAAVTLFVGSLLAKETAILLPPFLLFAAFAMPGRRPSPAEWRKGHVVLWIVAAVYVVAMYRIAWESVWVRVTGSIGAGWIARLLYFGTAALVPAHPEILEQSPWIWGGVAAIVGVTLLVAARDGSRRLPEGAWIAGGAFVILLGFSVFSFHERFFFLSSAAAAAAIASLLAAARPVARRAVLLVLGAGWLASTAWHWHAWGEAAGVSERIVEDLVQLSRGAGVAEIVVANMPHRVHGISISGGHGAAVLLTGRRSVSVLPALYVDSPGPRSNSLAGTLASAVHADEAAVEVSLSVPDRVFSRAVLSRGRDTSAPTSVVVRDSGDGSLVVRIPRAAGRIAAVWHDGALATRF